MTASLADLIDVLEGKKEGREIRGRCLIHGGRSLSITEKDGRILVVCRAGCPQTEVWKAIQALGIDGTNYIVPPPAPEPKDDTEKRIDKAEKMWSDSHPITSGDPVHKYLTGRGITLASWLEDLRCHPVLGYWEMDDSGKPVRIGVFPALLAVVRGPEGQPIGLHRTWVNCDGHGKAPVAAPKKIFKVHDLAGSAVRLFPPRDGLLAVTEGIEDALSAWVLWQIPTWATLGTSGMKSFDPPEGIKELLIFADQDLNGAGQRAAWELRDKMEEMGRAARVLVPGDGSKDLNAFLLARQGANIQDISR